MRFFRYLWRVPLLLLHMLLVLPTGLLVHTRWARQRQWRGMPVNERLVRWWTRTMLAILGIRSRRVGEPLANPVMFVANHTSWLDIVLLHSQRAVCFVAKAEIDRWPVVGWMARQAGTIFHKRGDSQSMARVLACMGERLDEGRSVAVFPEGSTGPADRVRTFHARILQPALEADAPVQPVALRYCRDDKLCTEIAFRRGENFFVNAMRLVGGPPLVAEVHFLEPLANRDEGRKAMAALARARVGQALGVS